MKKIAIVTINSMNFGNRLQNYALQRVLQGLGYSVTTLKRKKEPVGFKANIKYYGKLVIHTKGKKFRKFNRENINFAEEVVTRDEYPDNINKMYDYFVAGSDQIWNPHYSFVAGKCDFLEFAEDSQKISYAASFGVNEVPVDRIKEFSEYLSSFKALSVREKRGSEIVKELTGLDATVVLDPTLLLGEKQWKKIETNTRLAPKKKYIFVYALGEMNVRFKEKVEQLRAQYEILDVSTGGRFGKGMPIGPSEFLYLLRNAEMILTDSFHATVFSIIFHKKFITFNRTGLNMNSRIKSLAELTELDGHINQYNEFDCEFGFDFIKVEKLLHEEQKNSISFLKMAIED